ncbi:MAG: peptidylprolyl isomerase [Gammaproteobacteria bacterium]|nr:peptidylprolyl isomerase [Gammaproteobacteria bacterium]
MSLLPLLFLAAVTVHAAEELNRIVAVVNDDVVLENELEAKLSIVREQLRAQNTALPDEKILRQQVLERVIVDQLQLQLAASNNIQIDDETLTGNLRNIAEQNNMNLDQFRATLEREGHDFNAFREEIRNQIAIARLHQQMVGNRINVTEQEVDTLLANEKTWGGAEKEYHLGHILIAVPDGASPEQLREAQRKADDTVAALRGGADFAGTAVSVSAGQTALQGGDLGWRKAGQLPTVMAEIINGMHAGEIADPVRAAGGFHIVKLIEMRGEGRQVVTQTHVRHILLTADELLPESEVPSRLEQLRERLVGGEDFAALARSHSKDKVSASKGGDLGWVNPGDLVPQFEDAMKTLKVNEISQPVETRFGWHIIQVLERREHDSTVELKRNQARDLIRKRKTDEELALWLRRLRDEAYVEYRTEE